MFLHLSCGISPCASGVPSAIVRCVSGKLWKALVLGSHLSVVIVCDVGTAFVSSQLCWCHSEQSPPQVDGSLAGN